MLTQNERISRHLIDYGSITQKEALDEYGIMRLASRISDLKKQGFEIKSEIEKDITDTESRRDLQNTRCSVCRKGGQNNE